MEIEGKIIVIRPVQSGISQRTGKEWASQEYVLETAERYQRHMVFSVFGRDKISAMNIQPNETLIVHFDVDAHENKGRWYNSIQAWKVTRPNQVQQPAPVQPSQDMSMANNPQVQQVAQQLGAELPF